MLKPIIKDDDEILWCAPAAIAAISGRPTSQINKIIKHYYNGRIGKENPEGGVHVYVTQHILDTMGIPVKWVQDPKPLNDIINRNDIYLPVYNTIGDELHIVASCNGYFVDSMHLTPTSFFDFVGVENGQHECYYFEIINGI